MVISFMKILAERINKKNQKPGLNHYVTYGWRSFDESPEIYITIPESGYKKVIVDKEGYFQDFPGIRRGEWTSCLRGSCDLDEGRVGFRTEFSRKQEGGYQCIWEIQPDGRYWSDQDGYGGNSDSEILLKADLNDKGEFESAFCIYEIDGKLHHE